MSAMVVLLEFVRRESAIKKPPKTRAWSDRCTHSQDASRQPSPSLEAEPRIRALTLEYVMTFTMGYCSNVCPSRLFIKWASRIHVGRGLQSAIDSVRPRAVRGAQRACRVSI